MFSVSRIPQNSSEKWLPMRTRWITAKPKVPPFCPKLWVSSQKGAKTPPCDSRNKDANKDSKQMGKRKRNQAKRRLSTDSKQKEQRLPTDPPLRTLPWLEELQRGRGRGHRLLMWAEEVHTGRCLRHHVFLMVITIKGSGIYRREGELTRLVVVVIFSLPN